jgi:hypothetical protein
VNASTLMKAAASDAVRLRNHLKRCREYARHLGFDERLLLEIQSAHALEASLRALADKIGLSEARERINRSRGAA